MAPKGALRRYVAVEGVVVADPAARRPGRGAYTCQSDDCLRDARARGGFNRAFRRAVRAPLPQTAGQDGRPATVDERRRPAPPAHENVHLRHE